VSAAVETSAERTPGVVRELRAFAAEDRARMAAAAAGALEAWRAAWSLGPPPGARAVRCEVLPPGWDLAWHPAGQAGSGVAWCLWRGDLERTRSAARGQSGVLATLAAAMFGEAPSGPAADEPGSGISTALAEKGWSDLLERLAATLGDPACVAPAPCRLAPELERWTGTLGIEVPWWNGSLLLRVEGEAVGRRLQEAQPPRSAPPPRALAPIWRALATRSTKVAAELEGFQLDLGALVALREGDVLCTTHHVDEVIRVGIVDEAGAIGPAFGEGFLGARAGHRAIELSNEG